ncbi:EamA family transporter RarD [Microbulbifer harenosus]|uniref:EamA family transporter RarD n=1 Tax=Microbulbifer harenosus TaxID=2576840 RepID=A0ABY2ULY2_9GAMM|nr:MULTISPECIES: EamA family transporter RarD [Microbulbifer]QIL91099.1 EamA family transporter RarD [Microbulbifer sp. SH-1]TLM79320.1 EamA family transporter RarD [Microbulbifer harenosus]
MQNQNPESAASGLLAGIGAFLIWGLAPLYFNLLDGISAPEILSHRSIWAFVLALLMLAAMGKLEDLRGTLRSGRKMRTLLLSTLLIGSNWLVFIWAITNQHILDASLGYYINPLISVLLGVLFMGERLRPLQWLAVAIAAVGISYELWQFGRVPMIALFLALTFGFYGLVRKRAPVESLTGLAVETLYMLPLAVGFLIWTDSPSSNLLHNSWELNGLLLLAGPVTLTPLLLFNIAARRLNLSTVGFLQYLGPTLMLLLATFYYGEPLSDNKLITFAIVWFALLLYSADALLQRRKRHQLRKTAL